MNKTPETTGPEFFDALIDEALQDLTAGEPREGLRGRVLARIAEAPEPAGIRFVEILGWRVRPIQLATAGAIATLVLVAALAIPMLMRTGGSPPAESTTSARRPASSATRTVSPALPPGLAQQSQVAGGPAYLQPRRPADQRAAESAQARATHDETSTITAVRVSPLPDPDLIANQAIEIKPLEIQELSIPDIQLRPIDPSRPQRDNERRQ